LFGARGLAIPAHRLLTDNAQLTGFALALLGLAGAVRARQWTGFALGTGIGVAFLAKGLLGVAVIGAAAIFPGSPRGFTERMCGRSTAMSFARRFLSPAPEKIKGRQRDDPVECLCLISPCCWAVSACR